MAEQKKTEIKLVATNRKARHEYHLVLLVEAGLVLTGTEVKSLRDGKAALDDAHCKISPEGEIFVHSLDIQEYTHGNRMNHDPKRRRKLLLKSAEIRKLGMRIKEQGMTIIPTRLYFKGGWAKLEIALAKGKKHHDKREDMRAKDAKREMDRAYARRARE